MKPTQEEFEAATIAAAAAEGWIFSCGESGAVLWLSEGALALACLKAGYEMAESRAASVPDYRALLADLCNSEGVPEPVKVWVRGVRDKVEAAPPFMAAASDQ